MSEIQVKLPFVISTPPAEQLTESESFVINGIRYTVNPDVTGKVRGGKDGQFWFNQSKGFAGREFVIVTDSGRRIVTHNLWMGESVQESDNARFVGAEAKPVNLRQYMPRQSWELR